MAHALPSKASFDTLFLDRSYSGNDLHPEGSSKTIPINWSNLEFKDLEVVDANNITPDPTIPEHLKASLFVQFLEQVLLRPKNKDRPKTKAD